MQVGAGQAQLDFASRLAGDRQVFNVEERRRRFRIDVGETGLHFLRLARPQRQKVFARHSPAEDRGFDVAEGDGFVVERGLCQYTGDRRAADLAVGKRGPRFALVTRAADLRGHIIEREIVDDDRTERRRLDLHRLSADLIARKVDLIAFAFAGEGASGVRQFDVSDGSLITTRAAFDRVIRSGAVDPAIDDGLPVETLVQPQDARRFVEPYPCIQFESVTQLGRVSCPTLESTLHLELRDVRFETQTFNLGVVFGDARGQFEFAEPVFAAVVIDMARRAVESQADDVRILRLR